MRVEETVGIIGGTGQLGGAIARGWLKSGCIEPGALWISSRSGRSDAFNDWNGINFTTTNQELAEKCDVILLSVPPDLAMALEFTAPKQLVISVMAGVTIDQLKSVTGSPRIVRAMSNPAAEFLMAYSP